MKFETKIARAGYGEIDVRGRAMLGGVEHDRHPWSMVSVALGHRPLLDDEIEMLNLMANILFIGDPRLWPFRAQRVVGAYGNPHLSLAASMAFFSGASIGPPVAYGGMKILQEIANDLGMDPEQADVDAWMSVRLERGDKIPGYNVIARRTDERRDFMLRQLDDAGWLERPWFKLLEKVDGSMRSLKGIEPNAGSTSCAILLEVGLTPKKGSLLSMALSFWSNVANADEGTDSDYAAMQQLPSDCVEWRGAAPRQSPRSKGVD